MTSRHGSDGGRRGVATWIIVTVVAAVLVAGATIAYLLIVGSGSDKAAVACNSRVVLPVVAGPGAGAAVTAAAAAFDATAPVARSACVSTSVTTMPGSETESALADGWEQASGAAPAVWVADSEADLLALEATDSALTAGRDTTAVAGSPVVLAVRAGDAASVTAAALSWQGLAAATGPDGTVALPSGQRLVLALPDPITNRATSYALQSALAGSGSTVDLAAVTASAAELAAIGAGGPASQPDTTEQALTELAAGTGGFTAVPVVASDLVAFTTDTPGLTGISPTGGTVGDAIYAVPLSAGWITPTLEDASALFLAYLRGPGGDTTLTDNGLTVADAAQSASSVAPSVAPSGGTTTGGEPTQPETLPDAGPKVAAALAVAIGASPPG